MRPVEKWKVGDTIPNSDPTEQVQFAYKPYGDAAPILDQNIGEYCSYCECWDTNLEVEHVIPKNQINDPSQQNMPTINDWDNFLWGCSRCNGPSAKSDTYVYPQTIHLPHKNNTFLSFEYREAGVVLVNPVLQSPQKDKAEALMSLVELDRDDPVNYPRDKRAKKRREAWDFAQARKQELLTLTEDYTDKIKALVEFAAQRGYFSVWYTVFEDFPDVKRALIDAFPGTAKSCFDANDNYKPIWRNPPQDL